MSLPKSWTTVTPLSKTIAMVVLIFLPTLAFFAGVRYQQKIDQPLLQYQAPVQTAEKIIYQPLVDTETWKTYTNSKIGMTFKHPSTWMVQTKHTFSNREVDDPKEINTAVFTGIEGQIVLTWGPMGYGGGCDNWKAITIDGKDQQICNSSFENNKEIWAPISNGAQGERANEMRAIINHPIQNNRQTIFTIISTIHYFPK